MSELLDVDIQHSTLIHAEPERVYDAMTQGELLDQWFTSGTTIEAGIMHWRWKEWGPDKVTTEDKGPVLEADRPRRFVFQWRENSPTTVEINFESHPEGTVVRLRESGYKNTPEGRKGFMDCATGWGEALTLLKFYVEHGIRY